MRRAGLPPPQGYQRLLGLLGVLAGKQFYADGAKQSAAHEAGQSDIVFHHGGFFLSAMYLFALVARDHHHDHADHGAPGPEAMLFHQDLLLSGNKHVSLRIEVL